MRSRSLHRECNGYKRERWEQWSVMLTVQGAVITGITKPEEKAS